MCCLIFYFISEHNLTRLHIFSFMLTTYLVLSLVHLLGTAVAQWLRCCATNQKVAGSIPASVSGFFIDIKSFRSHYGPGVDSASNINEYQEYFLVVKAAGAYGWQPYHHPVPLSWNLGTLTSWNPLGHSRPVTGVLYLLLVHLLSYIYIKSLFLKFFGWIYNSTRCAKM